MNTIVDYELAYKCFTEIKALVDAWTHDHRGCARLSNVVYKELVKLSTDYQVDDTNKMSINTRDNAVGCLKMLLNAAKQSTTDHVSLYEKGMIVLSGLNLVFEKEGLEKIEGSKIK